MDLSIIVVNWNTRELLAQCLKSLERCQLSISGQGNSLTTDNPSPITDHCALTAEIFVVDNASSDGSAAMVRKCFPQVRLIENCENVGFARANNQAVRESSGRYVLLLNSDSTVEPNSLANMAAFMDAHPETGILGGNILNADGTSQFCYGRFPSLLSETAFAWGLDTHFPLSMRFKPCFAKREFIETDWVVGAALMVRRELLDRVGLLDESYFMYSEEIDLAYRARCDGWRTYVLRDARIVHLRQQSSKQAAAAMKAQLFRSKVLYFQKHHGRTAASLLQSVFASSILAKWWVYRLQRKSGLSQMWSETFKHFVGNSEKEFAKAKSIGGLDYRREIRESGCR
jgi:hypothetical protein